MLTSVVRRGSFLTGAGIAAGLALSIAATGLISKQLLGVSAADPLLLLAVALFLLLIGFLASHLPALRQQDRFDYGSPAPITFRIRTIFRDAKLVK